MNGLECIIRNIFSKHYPAGTYWICPSLLNLTTCRTCNTPIYTAKSMNLNKY